MYQLRRLTLLFVVLVIGMLLIIINEALIFIVGVPSLMLLFMKWDEVSYMKNTKSTAKNWRSKR
ncbi:hypothetical protein CBF30_08495 [Vagococcus entomophilus]|uniref:Uncharacterized protein n=1 Tax=Vagococcus entomophilus TaxID=1160095 RepID=A0A430AH97_9ENTE|nr:hypothetical protein CBF30_08495 [Vagococcus entomophilus]